MLTLKEAPEAHASSVPTVEVGEIVHHFGHVGDHPSPAFVARLNTEGRIAVAIITPMRGTFVTSELTLSVPHISADGALNIEENKCGFWDLMPKEKENRRLRALVPQILDRLDVLELAATEPAKK